MDTYNLYLGAMQSCFIPLEVEQFQEYMDAGYLSITDVSEVWIEARITENLIRLHSDTPDTDILRVNALGYATLQSLMDSLEDDPITGSPILDGVNLKTLEYAGSQFLVTFVNGDTGIYEPYYFVTYYLNTHEVAMLCSEYEAWILPPPPPPHSRVQGGMRTRRWQNRHGAGNCNPDGRIPEY